jgi:transposase
VESPDDLEAINLPHAASKSRASAATLVTERYHVSRAWVDALKQRRRETGDFAPLKQTRWRTPILTAQLTELEALIRAQPDRTLAELRAALQTTAGLATIWRAVKQLGFTLKKNGPRVRTGSPRCRGRA